MQQITLNRDCIAFLKSLLKINDTAIIVVDENQMTSLVGTPDNVTVTYGILPCVTNFKGFLNISSISKLLKALEQINEESYNVNVTNNYIEYKSPSLRFKYHLLENGIISQPAINIKKVLEFAFNVNFKVSAEKFTSIVKFSSFSSDSNKIYLSSDGFKVLAELTDKARDNVDSFEFEFGECATPFDAVSLNVDFFRSLSFSNNSSINIGINTQMGVVSIDISNPAYKLKYITTSYTS
jgi:hypothetical protein